MSGMACDQGTSLSGRRGQEFPRKVAGMRGGKQKGGGEGE